MNLGEGYTMFIIRFLPPFCGFGGGGGKVLRSKYKYLSGERKEGNIFFLKQA